MTMLHKAMQGKITIRIRLGPGSADQSDQAFEADTLIGSLITYCKQDFRLPEQDNGEMIRYALYREQGAAKVKLDKGQSLRILRIQAYDVLYLADERRIWWQSSGTEPLRNGSKSPRPPQPTPPPSNTRPPISSPLPQTPPRPVSSIPCSIELAPGCVRTVPEVGLIINREYLLQQLPKSVSTRERALILMGLQSRLEMVSRDSEGHCALVYRQGWYLLARHTVYIGSNKYNNSEALPLEQTVTLLLGSNGWPITIRLHSTQITP